MALVEQLGVDVLGLRSEGGKKINICCIAWCSLPANLVGSALSVVFIFPNNGCCQEPRSLGGTVDVVKVDDDDDM